ncbi:MAG: DNA polymerase, partial [Magnetococcus sp. XQGC-1]
MNRAAQDALLHGDDPLSEFRKKGVIHIGNFDNMCLTRAVSVCLFYNKCFQFHKESSEFKAAVNDFESVRHDERSRHYFQRQAAETLCVLTGIDIDTKTSDVDIEKIADNLKLCIKIVSNEGFGIDRIFGNKENPSIYLLERKLRSCFDKSSPEFVSRFTYHLDAIIDMKVLKKARHYCTFCDVATHYIESHRCADIAKEKWCYACYDRTCSNQSEGDGPYASNCSKCGIVCRNIACAERHKALKLCGTFFCSKCSRRLQKKEITPGEYQSTFEALALHSCWITCHLCGREKKENEIHKCFMLRQPFRDISSKLLFLDFETDQSSGTHVPIFCAMEWVELCEDDHETITHQGSKTFGLDYGVADDVGAFLFQTQAFKGYSIIAHNMRGFDGCFLLQYLIERNFQVDLICNGLKLTSVFVPGLDIRLIDSLNFFQMSLAGIVSAMGLENVVKAKGYFPHFFVAPDKLNYIGPLPDPDMFGCRDMKAKQYAEFMEWYNQNKDIPWNFAESMKLYCCQDVTILKEGVLKFRKTVINMIANIPVQKNELPDERAAR